MDEWLAHYCTMCAPASGGGGRAGRRLELLGGGDPGEATHGAADAEHRRLKARVREHVRGGEGLRRAWELVREENDGECRADPTRAVCAI